MSESENAAESAAPDTEEPAYVLPHCKCGTNRNDKHSVVESEYTLLGSLYMIWGGTTTPTKVKFRCILCGEFFDASTAPSVCKEYSYRG